MKFKRYEGGGEISGTVDPKEAADKEAGLKASKGDDVGFLQRLRMGNIDDPSSEAYKRFGAGRGRSKAAEEAPTKAPTESPAGAVPRPLAYPNPIFAAGLEQGKRQLSGDAGVAEDYAKRPRNPEAEQEADNPRKTAPKPTGKREVGESVSGTPTVRNKMTAPSLGNDDYGPSTSKAPTQPSLGNDDYGPSSPKESKVSTPSAVKPKPAAEAPSKGKSKEIFTPENIANIKSASEKVKGMGSSVVDYFSNLETTGKRLARERKEKAAKGSYSSGGSVSSASKRADGIATKGKTRGKYI